MRVENQKNELSIVKKYRGTYRFPSQEILGLSLKTGLFQKTSIKRHVALLISHPYLPHFILFHAF
jgi:hypothetical protein